MNNLNSILEKMAADKNIKTVSIELKRMSGGIKLTYETRVGNDTKMGLEYIDAKDFDNDKGLLAEMNHKVMGTIMTACDKPRDDS